MQVSTGANKYFTFSGHLETVEVLIAKGADANALTRTKGGKHAAEFALRNGN